MLFLIKVSSCNTKVYQEVDLQFDRKNCFDDSRTQIGKSFSILTFDKNISRS